MRATRCARTSLRAVSGLKGKHYLLCLFHVELGAFLSAMREEPVPRNRDCRIVAFYRVVPGLLNIGFPPGFELRAINGYGIGGIVLVQRPAVRSSLIPARLVTFESALHFIDVMQIRQQHTRTGSLIIRHDTSSRLNTWLHRPWRRCSHHACFRITETPDSIAVECDSDDQVVHVAIKARPERRLSRRSVFQSKDQLLQILHDDLKFVRLTRDRQRRGGSERIICRSQLMPLKVQHIESSVFGDPRWFREGAAEFDSAYQLRDDELVWNEHAAVCCDVATA